MRKGKPLYLFAHSMGGCIGTLYLEKHPEYQTNCGSYQWVHGAIQAGKIALNPENMKRISSPVLLFQGTDDTFVTSRAHKIFVNNILDGRIILVKSRHEIWRGTNNILEPYLAEIFSFLQ